MQLRGRWEGGTAICLASGPSLTQEDADRVIAWRDAAPKRYAVCANTTFRLVPKADALFAFDAKWWAIYIDEVKRNFTGERFSMAVNPPQFGVERLGHFKPFGNSGSAAVSLAIDAGCKTIALLGFDCMHGPNGEVHHHGDHPKPLGNAFSLPRWPKAFEKLATHATLAGVRVINCSRRTALTCFERGELNEFLDS